MYVTLCAVGSIASGTIRLICFLQESAATHANFFSQENLTSKISASLKHSNPRLDVSLLAGTMGSLSNMNETTGSDLTVRLSS